VEPRILMRSWELSIAQVIALNTSSLVLLPATPGVLWFPIRFHTARLGAAYATQGGALQIRYLTSAPFAHIQITVGTAPLTTRRSALAFGVTSGNYGNDEDQTVDVAGKAIQLHCSVANPTVDVANPGSPVVVTLWVEVWPTNEKVHLLYNPPQRLP
jgi:hypothetical protein